MRKMPLPAGAPLLMSLLLAGCLGFPVVTVRTLVPTSSIVLGERFESFGDDHDRFVVHPRNERFRSLYFVVEDRDVEIYDFVVVYADGQRERYDTPLVFAPGARSQTFALRGGPRRIQGIEFRYRTRGRWADNRAHLTVYGVK